MNKGDLIGITYRTRKRKSAHCGRDCDGLHISLKESQKRATEKLQAMQGLVSIATMRR